jgi:hypothetical protein
VNHALGMAPPRPRLAGETERPWRDGWPTLVSVFAIASVLALAAVVFDWRGSDLPAQVFRTDLVRRDGFVLWNSQWFGGHAMLPYSVLSPVVGALTGPVALGAVTGVAAAVLFERILRLVFGRTAWPGALWFALGTVTNLIVGRVTFSLGIAFGLGAVYALLRRRPALAVVGAVLCSLSSPLAGAFLALAAAAWVGARRGRDVLAPLAVLAGALTPVATIALLFPEPGAQPYELWAFAWDLVLCSAIAAAAKQYPGLRWGAAVYAAAAAAAYVVPTPLGGNVSRLGQYVAGPLLACLLLRRGRGAHLALAVLSVPLVIWQWYPVIDPIAIAGADPSTRASYYEPVLAFLRAQDVPISRVEIPSTYRKWEAAYAAPHVLLARGWERQLDIGYNTIFYSDGLTAETYREWLEANGVAYVALPDTRLDESSLAERELLERGLPYLEPVWRNPHWRVWRVKGFRGLVDGSATLTHLAPDKFVLEVHEPGDVVVRVRATRHWSVPAGGCAQATDDGWTQLRGLPRGTVEVRHSLTGTRCPD